MKPKVLKSEHDHKEALNHIEALMAKPSPDEAELELWALLVEKYEDDNFAIDTPDPVDAIRFRMEQGGMVPADLRPYLQSKSKVSEVMNRKRTLTLSMMRSLHDGLKIPADVLLRESMVHEPAAPYLTVPAPARSGKSASSKRRATTRKI